MFFSILQNILMWFQKLFGLSPKKSIMIQESQEKYAAEYAAADKPLNITAIVALKLSNIICSYSIIEVKAKDNELETPRIEYLNTQLQRIVDNLELIVMRVLGIGGVVLKPYIYGGQIYVDIISQKKYFVVDKVGEIVTKSMFVADYFHVQTYARHDEYARLEYHSLDKNGVYTIIHKGIKNGMEIPISSVPEWANIPAEPVTITGVDRMLYSFITCPVDNRKAEANSIDNIYGVPITFGQEINIDTVNRIINEILPEFINKRAFIGADEILFDSKNKLPASGFYKLFRAGGGVDKNPFWEVFSPDIRQTPYIEAVTFMLGIIEKGIGIDKGILTDLMTSRATATEIKRSAFNTEALANRLQNSLDKGINDIVYTFDVLANRYNLSPYEAPNYEVTFTWSNWSEDSDSRWQMLLQGQAAGAVNGYELRQNLFGEDKNTAIANMPEQIQTDMFGASMNEPAASEPMAGGAG